VKNALVAVKTYTDLLLEKQPDNDSAALVRREVGRIDSLIGQLLQLAGPGQRLEADLSLHEILEHALRLLQPHMRDRKVEQVLVLGSSIDRIWGDSRQLQQAFLNLFFNAIEAMDGGGRLAVRTELVFATEHISKFDPGRREQQIQVEIQDSGPGIPPAELDRSFMPFVTTKPNGTGLGLAITQKIIVEHRGRISVEGRPGEGALFRVILPLWKRS
jgi:two-component system nitrogen regulation sensor histidine kinase GlnL